MTDPLYNKLIAAWTLSSASPGALPPDVTGTSLYGLSTAQKLAAINQWKVKAPLDAELDQSAILSLFDSAELQSFTTSQFQLVNLFLTPASVDFSPAAGNNRQNMTKLLIGSGTLASPSYPNSLANFNAALAKFDNNQRFWTVVNGYPGDDATGGNLSGPDASNAGLT